MDYPLEEDVPYRIWGQKVKGALDIEVEEWFQGSKMLPFPPRVTISHIWTTHGRKMFLLEFRVKRSSSALVIEVEIWFLVSRTLPIPPRVTISHI
jgi:hypothetical protein